MKIENSIFMAKFIAKNPVGLLVKAPIIKNSNTNAVKYSK
jgi:hypothetical protein